MNTWIWMGLAGIFLSPLSAHAGKRYESLMIDPVDLTATLGAPLGMFAESAAWFEKTPLPGGGMRVADMRDGGCRGAFDFSAGDRLVHRARTLQVLETGFGSVYANFDSWYPPAVPKIAVNTFARRADFPHRAPGASAPVPGPADGFALIRVFKTKDAKKSAFASADYDSAGQRRSFRVVIGTGAVFEALAAPAEAGLPKSVQPASFSQEPFAGVEGSPEPGELRAALVYRARGTSVERIVANGASIKREWLSFPLTEAERGLAKLEARYPLTPGP